MNDATKIRRLANIESLIASAVEALEEALDIDEGQLLAIEAGDLHRPVFRSLQLAKRDIEVSVRAVRGELAKRGAAHEQPARRSHR